MRTVAVFPSDSTGCGLYRCIWPAHTLAEAGRPVQLYTLGDPARMTALTRYSVLDDRYHVTELINEPDAEVIVFARPSSRLVVEAMRLLQKAGHAIVAELDDDLARLDPGNVAFASLDPKLSPDANHQWLVEGVLQADWRVFSTPALYERYGERGDWVVPNAVPDAFLEISGTESEKQGMDGVRIGWAGSVATHPKDLQVVGNGVERALRQTDGRFWVVGPTTGVPQALGIASRRVMGTGTVPVLSYAASVAGAFDVAIAPLASTPFNEAKSWLKPLEMMALGLPVVASPGREYRALSMIAPVQLADTPREWAKRLTDLVKSPNLRFEKGIEGRIAVEQVGLTLSRAAGEFYEAWSGPNPHPDVPYVTDLPRIEVVDRDMA